MDTSYRRVAALVAGLSLVATGMYVHPAPAAARPERERPPHVPVDTTPVGGPPTEMFRGGVQRSEEVTDLRTRTSRTFRNDFGAFETEFFTGSIHYRTKDGWEPIDNTLVGSGAGNGVENRANEYSLHLPRAMGSGPVRFGIGTDFISLDLQGAQGRPAEVRGNRATYDDAFAGVDVVYEALNDSVKEELLLESASSTSTFTWRMNTSPSLTATGTPAGGIDFVASDGSVRMSIPPPVIYDASGPDGGAAPAHSFDLVPGEGVDELSLTVDQTWLSSPERAFPVTVDPTVANATQKDCYIVDGDQAGMTFCSAATIKVGQRSGYRKRGLLKFDVSNIPDNAEILLAKMGLFLQSTSSQVPTEIAARPLKTPFSEFNASWDDPGGSARWQTPGGDFDNARGYVNSDFTLSNGWKYWYPTRLVKGWVANGLSENHGVLLKAVDETTNQEATFASRSDALTGPKLTVVWDKGGMGELATYTTEDKELTERRKQRVNVVSGNLLVHETDFSIKGVGMDLVFDRYYNSLPASERMASTTSVGQGWNLSNAGDVGLKLYFDQDPAAGETPPPATAARAAVFFGPSGYRVPFVKEKSNETFQRPPGLNADLRYAATADEYVLTFRGDEDRYAFSGSGMLKRHEDKNGNKLTYLYESGSKVSSIIDTQGRSTKFHYYTSGPAAGKLWQVEDPAYRFHTFTYEGQNLSTYTDPKDNQTLYGYDAGGRLNRIKNPEGHETLYEYDATNRIIKIRYVTDRSTTPWTEDVTAVGYSASTQDLCSPTNPQKNYRGAVAHADMPLMTSVVDANQYAGGARPGDTAATAPITRYCYDRLGRIRLVRDQQGNRTHASYNSDGNMTSYINANEAEFQLDYETGSNAHKGNLVGTTGFQTTGQVPARTTANYTDPDHPGFPTTAVDAGGNRTEYTYDSDGNLTKIVLGANAPDRSSTFRYEYDAAYGTLLRIRAPESPGLPPSLDTAQGNDTLMEYYPDGNLKRIDYPLPMGDVLYEYDGLSRVTRVSRGTDTPTGVVYQVTWVYHDELDRLTNTWIPEYNWWMTWVYDKVGNVIQRDDYPAVRTIRSTYTYDLENQPKTETHPSTSPPAGTQPLTTEYTYDRVGNLTQVKKAGNPVVTYAYDSVNVLDSLTEEPSGARTEFNHNKLYKFTKIRYVTPGVEVGMGYDNSGNMTSIRATRGSSVLVALDYDYFSEGGGTKSDQGLLQKMKDTTDGRNVATRYSYDALNRLTRASVVNEATVPATELKRHVYSYDANSNLTSANEEIAANAMRRFDYDNANQLACSYKGASCNDASAPGTTYTHDSRGNLSSSSAGLSIDYDVRDRLGYVDRPGTSQKISMGYEGQTQEERTQRTLESRARNPVWTESWMDNDMLGLERERTGSHVTVKYVRDNKGTPIGLQHEAGSTTHKRYFIRDHLGSVIATVGGQTGAIKERYAYDPYGNMEVTTEPDAEVTNPWRYAGAYYEEASGLHKMGVRYYDPSIYRFTQMDPVRGQIGNPLTLNPYSYAACNPTNFVDPSGMFFEEVGAALIAGVVGGGVLGIPGVGPTTAAAAGGCAYEGALTFFEGGNGTDVFLGCLQGAVLGVISGAVAHRLAVLFRGAV